MPKRKTRNFTLSILFINIVCTLFIKGNCLSVLNGLRVNFLWENNIFFNLGLHDGWNFC